MNTGAKNRRLAAAIHPFAQLRLAKKNVSAQVRDVLHIFETCVDRCSEKGFASFRFCQCKPSKLLCDVVADMHIFQ